MPPRAGARPSTLPIWTPPLRDWPPTARPFPALIAYAVKANPDPQLLRRLVADGAGCEVVTAVELAFARNAGCPGERIVMNGVGKRDEELHLALAAGALVNAESLDELARLVALAADHPTARIGLRLNPALDADTHPHLATGAAGASSRIALAIFPAALGAPPLRADATGRAGRAHRLSHRGGRTLRRACPPPGRCRRDRHCRGPRARADDLGGGLAGTERRSWPRSSVLSFQTAPP